MFEDYIDRMPAEIFAEMKLAVEARSGREAKQRAHEVFTKMSDAEIQRWRETLRKEGRVVATKKLRYQYKLGLVEIISWLNNL